MRGSSSPALSSDQHNRGETRIRHQSIRSGPSRVLAFVNLNNNSPAQRHPLLRYCTKGREQAVWTAGCAVLLVADSLIAVAWPAHSQYRRRKAQNRSPSSPALRFVARSERIRSRTRVSYQATVSTLRSGGSVKLSSGAIHTPERKPFIRESDAYSYTCCPFSRYFGLSFAICCSLRGRELALAPPATGRCASFRRPHLNCHPSFHQRVLSLGSNRYSKSGYSSMNISPWTSMNLRLFRERGYTSMNMSPWTSMFPRPRERHSFFSGVPPRPASLPTKQPAKPWCARLSSRIPNEMLPLGWLLAEREVDLNPQNPSGNHLFSFPSWNELISRTRSSHLRL